MTASRENPIIAEATRGSLTESLHRGSFVVCDRQGKVVNSAGQFDLPVFPRSAIKAFQCLPVIESGAAGRFGFTDEEIALCCSSHNSELEHISVAASMLRKCGASENAYECGPHWPGTEDALHAMVHAGEKPRRIHNNCSGKHAGMIALAIHLGVPPAGYSGIDHPVQQAVARAMGSICDVDLAKCQYGIDGCSLPTWAFPLRNMALGFARLGALDHKAGQRIIVAVRNNPFMVAGSGRFDTKIMQAVPRLFIKVGAEGVFCGSIPHAGLGFALKCDDGGIRGAEVAVAALLVKLDVWTGEERKAISAFTHTILRNWMKTEVGEVRAAF
jgi:L-asparaginase II